MKTRRWGPFKQSWYSICSKHLRYLESCNLCQAGEWCNNIGHRLDGLVYRLSYPLWYWLNNRPSSKSKKRLKKWFPNLK